MECVVLPWKIARKLAGFSQGDLARRGGVDQSHLSKIERRQGIAGADFAAAVWAVVGPPNAPVELGEWVRDPEDAGIDADWCCALGKTLDSNDPRWMTYLVQRWFPDRKFLPAFPRDDGPGMLWWYAAFSLALNISLPNSLVSRLHSAPASEIVSAFREWAETVAAAAQGRAAASPTDQGFPMDLWNWLNQDEQSAVILLVRRLAASHRPE